MIKMIILVFVSIYISIVLGLYLKTTYFSEFDKKRSVVLITPIITIQVIVSILLDKKPKCKKTFVITHLNELLLLTTFILAESYQKIKIEDKNKNKKNKNNKLTNIFTLLKKTYSDKEIIYGDVCKWKMGI